jgi:hypothetical protein
MTIYLNLSYSAEARKSRETARQFLIDAGIIKEESKGKVVKKKK